MLTASNYSLAQTKIDRHFGFSFSVSARAKSEHICGGCIPWQCCPHPGLHCLGRLVYGNMEYNENTTRNMTTGPFYGASPYLKQACDLSTLATCNTHPSNNSGHYCKSQQTWAVIFKGTLERGSLFLAVYKTKENNNLCPVPAAVHHHSRDPTWCCPSSKAISSLLLSTHE